MTLQQIVAVAFGGAIGAVARFAVSHTVAHTIGSTFPWGTLTVNVFGALVLGFFVELSSLLPVSVALRGVVAVGFLGAFTTFSTFAVETVHLFRADRWLAALANTGLNVVVATAAALAGVVIARTLLRGS